MSNDTLKVPNKQEFAINNIQMNMSRAEVEKVLGKPKRVTTNEYGTKWYTYYHHNYKGFILVSYINNKVHALYTNQNSISSKSKIKYNSPKHFVREQLGKPLKYKRKGNKRFKVDNREYDNYEKDGMYTTIFYDKYNQQNLTAILIVSKKMENRLQDQYGVQTKNLASSFELQNFDIINGERAQRNLSTLSYSKALQSVAKRHSYDMIKNNYFDHQDLEGNSPFDRIKQRQISFNGAGENIAAGQQNSIFAHQAFMNSKGHRRNILRSEYKMLGVGVDFDKTNRPYWTENYLY
ncbi:CAP domain-containing protein [Staphylococcus sp. SQ8-PEA]|uniref:CAP domain-containing protein n=1 Tax=Staphylococcus marylandisciuri TaxID=2981529 RepID=A0ABT2QNN4_9STAP|nr:CAP domain-containing protein [Staphylococcus marylandisciuri]MCU5745593.1 CAP domain-containing protein [Staphylococcus marylandisciuri]